VTISGNTAPPGDGAAIRNVKNDAGFSNPQIYNSIIWGNGTDPITDDGILGATLIITDSVVEGGCPTGTGISCTNVLTGDPELSILADNGGFTQTIAISATGSAYNTGGVNYACAATDQRGVTRPQAGDCDIGAFEIEDNTAPSLDSFELQTPSSSPTNADTLVFRATFSEDVQNVDASDFAKSGTSTAGVTNVVSINASTYDVTVSGGDLAGFNGEVGLDLNGGQNITDLAGNALPADEPGTDETYTLDNTAPTVTIGTPSPTTTTTGPVNFSITVSGADTVNLIADNVSLNTTDTATGTISVTDGTTANPTVTISSITGNGTIGISIAAGIASDAVGNTSAAAGPSDTYSVDNAAPILASFTRQTPSSFPTNADTLIFRATFSEDVQNVSMGDFTVDGATTATVTDVATVNASTYDLTVSGGNLADYNGEVGLNLDSGQNITDLIGNALPAGEPSTDETYLVDNTPPAVTSITRADDSPTSASSVDFTVTFSEAVTGVDTSDFSLTTTVSGASVTSVTDTGDQTVYTVTVDTGSGDGTLRLDLNASGTGIEDLAGNPINGGYTAGEEYIITKPATVDVYIGGNLEGSHTIPTTTSLAFRYGINGGPVQVVSTNGLPIFTSERALYGSSFNSIVGFPGNQMATEYWFTTLDDLGMITYLVIGNPDTTQTALVDVYIGGTKMNTTPYSIAPGERVYPRYGINGGPVRVVSTNGVPIFTSERTKYKTSFNEVLGYPADRFATEYWFTTLDDLGMITYLVIGNPDETQTAEVDVYIAGTKMNSTPYTIAPGERVYPRYGINGGPVQVVSTNGVAIFVSERSKYLESFNEILGIGVDQLTTDYWFTTLDDLGMDTELVISMP
jgi:hypothetical protein